MKYYIKGTDILVRESEHEYRYASICGNSIGNTMCAKSKEELLKKLDREWFAHPRQIERKGYQIGRHSWRKATTEELERVWYDARRHYWEAVKNIRELEAR